MQPKIIEELQDEIRKLKAMIVKHEKRIRVLEASATEAHEVKAGQEKSDADAPPPLPSEPPPSITVGSNSHSTENLAADEV